MEREMRTKKKFLQSSNEKRREKEKKIHSCFLRALNARNGKILLCKNKYKK